MEEEEEEEKKADPKSDAAPESDDDDKPIIIAKQPDRKAIAKKAVAAMIEKEAKSPMKKKAKRVVVGGGGAAYVSSSSSSDEEEGFGDDEEEEEEDDDDSSFSEEEKKKQNKKRKQTANAANKKPAAAAGPGRKRKAKDTIPFVDAPRIFNRWDDPAEMKADYDKYGLILVKVLDDDACNEHIEDQVRNILLKQPWVDQLVVRDAKGNPVDFEKEPRRYVELLKAPKQPRKTIAEWKKAWCLHRGFGATCDPWSFWLETVCETRQDPRLYRMAKTLLGRDDLWVDINRSIQKLPGEGEHEFLHWDRSPFNEEDNWDTDCTSINGKVMANEAFFVYVPETASEEFRRSFVAAYREHYPNAKPKDPKFGLDASKPDPFNLVGRRVAVRIPAGCAAFWKPTVCHGVRPKELDENIEFGFYLGYFPAISRPRYAEVSKSLGEIEDRVASYHEGRAPLLWPSFDRIHYYPFRFYNFPRHLMEYVNKTRPGWPGLTTRTIQSGAKKGTSVPHMVPIPLTESEPHYEPFAFTHLGQRLLGLVPW